MNYELKDKISTTPELLKELETKGWQEIGHLQDQLVNLAEGPKNDKLRQLFKNLLTSYYVFTGGIEALADESIENIETEVETHSNELASEPDTEAAIEDTAEVTVPKGNFSSETDNDYEVNEPFEYFVDFDEPIGDPLTDDDLYS